MPLGVSGLCLPISVIGFGGFCIACFPVDPLGLVSISRSLTILPKEGKPPVGCYSLGFIIVQFPAEVCSRAFGGSTFEYCRSALLSLTVSTDPS